MTCKYEGLCRIYYYMMILLVNDVLKHHKIKTEKWDKNIISFICL